MGGNHSKNSQPPRSPARRRRRKTTDVGCMPVPRFASAWLKHDRQGGCEGSPHPQFAPTVNDLPSPEPSPKRAKIWGSPKFTPKREEKEEGAGIEKDAISATDYADTPNDTLQKLALDPAINSGTTSPQSLSFLATGGSTSDASDLDVEHIEINVSDFLDEESPDQNVDHTTTDTSFSNTVTNTSSAKKEALIEHATMEHESIRVNPTEGIYADNSARGIAVKLDEDNGEEAEELRPPPRRVLVDNLLLPVQGRLHANMLSGRKKLPTSGKTGVTEHRKASSRNTPVPSEDLHLCALRLAPIDGVKMAQARVGYTLRLRRQRNTQNEMKNKKCDQEHSRQKKKNGGQECAFGSSAPRFPKKKKDRVNAEKGFTRKIGESNLLLFPKQKRDPQHRVRASAKVLSRLQRSTYNASRPRKAKLSVKSQRSVETHGRNTLRQHPSPFLLNSTLLDEEKLDSVSRAIREAELAISRSSAQDVENCGISAAQTNTQRRWSRGDRRVERTDSHGVQLDRRHQPHCTHFKQLSSHTPAVSMDLRESPWSTSRYPWQRQRKEKKLLDDIRVTNACQKGSRSRRSTLPSATTVGRASYTEIHC